MFVHLVKRQQQISNPGLSDLKAMPFSKHRAVSEGQTQ